MTFQPIRETRDMPGNVRALQTVLSESKEQTLTWCVTQLSRLQGQNQTQRKRRGKK